MGTAAHAIRSNDCLNTTGGRSFTVNGLFEEPGALERYEAAQADNEYVMAPCHATPGAIAPHGDSVLIAVDGGCRRNGQPDALAAYAVFFAPSSRFNRSQILATDNATPTSQRAELTGGITALKEAKELTIPTMLMPRGQVRDLKQVVIKTDSEYLCFGATEWIAKWKTKGWKNARGRPVANRDLFKALDAAIRALEEMDILVQFWHVPREQNREADALANETLYKREKAASRTQRRRDVLVISLEDQWLFSEMYRDFLKDLEDHAQVHMEDNVWSALDYLRTNRPDAIIVADPYLAKECDDCPIAPQNALMWRLKEYVTRGGTAVFGCLFSTMIPPPDLDVFFPTHFGLPWKTGSYQRLSAKVSPQVHARMPRGASLPTACNQKALHLADVGADARLYELTDARPSQGTETPVAWAKVGQGWIGYIGDVNNEQATQQTVLAMCGLAG